MTKEANTRGTKLKENFKETAKMELGTHVTSLFDCYQSELMDKKNEAMSKFESGVNLLQSTIAAMATNKVPDDNEALQNMKKSLEALLIKREEFAKSIASKFIDLGNQQKFFFDKLIGETPELKVA